MNISRNWLSEYIDLKVSTEELVDKIKLHSTNVEGVKNLGENIKGVIVGKIIEINEHPNAEKIVICKVDVGDKVLQILTADKSVRENDLVPVAIDGAVLAGNFKIKSRKMRGIMSEGMMCSLEELGLEEKSEFVYKIPEEIKLGTDFVEYLKLKDDIIDIEIFPNRPDLLSYFGVAKEFIAIDVAKNFEYPEILNIEKGEGFPVYIEYEGCKRYAALVMENVEIKSSPSWLVKKLATAGIRSINNVVDITNYVLLETGHPVHAFDMDLIGNKIVVRKAMKGEKVKLLDEKEYELNGTETLITDGEKILALGGIMGGQDSGINENTKKVLLEVAYFDPVNIRKSARYHKISSDSSYRFERGVDPNDVELVMSRLAYLIHKLANGKVASVMTDVYPEYIKPKKVYIRNKYLNERLGVSIKTDDVEKILNRLDFENKKLEEKFEVTIPTSRPDITDEIDLVEEIGRIYGYHNIPSVLPFNNMIGGISDYIKFREKVSEVMRLNGYNEAFTFAFMDNSRMWLKKGEIFLENPISSELATMRPLLVYGVLESASYNFRNQSRNIKLFEIGKSFLKDDTSETGVKEIEKLAFVGIGEENPYDYTDKRNVNFYTFKGALDNLFDYFGITAEYKRYNAKGMSHSQSAMIIVNNEEIGFIGKIDKDIAKDIYDINQPVYIAEINIEKMYEAKKERKKNVSSFEFPSMRRDYSMLINDKITFFDIKNIIQKVGKKLVEEIKIFDVYKGKNIEEGKTSITITVTYRAKDRTLTDDEINRIAEKTIKRLKEELGIQVRV
ncbi:phenylalanyl-tRNA synthetase beta subunit [Marinitoga hydrogenitolerans DSM 16785]|uniref:Phenylalanine--tRNA ligase beta subunit n=1 Tax=Marinitoga hydrogenitolerans (strain DSM 16785 / JCM 12826 / AT1271) TaxID=1122195 RepID=A0A1M4V3R5_MARH1|nr:phenylalanine--tRNA ligase subunit beta [Marinitoga hydrogenitolerans]SHE63540.1 phenylalanyl-tRNA synthetase beta subunit [Marinitoga hydrogenitolerans DSM 16785]